MRTFIAIELEAEVRAAVRDVQRELKRRTGLGPPEVKWVEPENMHLTLKFLGEVPDDRIMDLHRAVEAACGDEACFAMELDGVGTFGRPPRVLWVGVKGCEALMEVQRRVEEAVALLGYPPEGRAFSGHLTLARIKSTRAGRRLAEALEGYEPRLEGEQAVESVCFFRSDLTKAGPIYTLMSRCELRPA